ncbi:MAG: YceK/YidQ family lipoprotein [bacterium]|nr:YceK/YidQ family lipoprotein [bacterium]
MKRLNLIKQIVSISSLIVSVLTISGCATIYTQTTDNRKNEVHYGYPLPRVYSGTVLDFYGLGADNMGIFALCDLPLSLALDTIILPYTIPRQLKYGPLETKTKAASASNISSVGVSEIVNKGDRIVFLGWTNTNNKYRHYAYILNLDGKQNNLDQVPVNEDSIEITGCNLSPDGNKLLYAYHPKEFSGKLCEDTNLASYDVNSNSVTLLDKSKDLISDASFSPACDEILFRQYDKNTIPADNLYIIDFGEGNKRKLSLGNLSATSPSWSADGKEIVFIGHNYSDSSRDRRGYIYIINKEGTGLRILNAKNDYSYLVSPRISPNKGKITFIESGSVFICDIDGGNLQLLYWDNTYKACELCWSPDGKYILFSTGKFNKNQTLAEQIDVMDINGQNHIILFKDKNIKPSDLQWWHTNSN